jgi:hypothetical protein
VTRLDALWHERVKTAEYVRHALTRPDRVGQSPLNPKVQVSASLREHQRGLLEPYSRGKRDAAVSRRT